MSTTSFDALVKHQHAMVFATEIRMAIAPCCLKTAIAGGLRRQKTEVHDIEIVALPMWERGGGLFEDEQDPALFSPTYCSEVCVSLDKVLLNLERRGVMVLDKTTPRNGSFYKRYVVPDLDNLPCEFFFARNLNNWGNTLAIRTGNADWSHACVTSREFGGLLRSGIRQREGFAFTQCGDMIPCPTEASFFQLCGLSTPPPPEARNADLAVSFGARRSLFEKEEVEA